MNKAEKWDAFLKGINWLGNPSVDILIREHYAMAQGNHEKYLKIKKLKGKVGDFFAKDADPNMLNDYSECYATLGVIKGILFDEEDKVQEFINSYMELWELVFKKIERLENIVVEQQNVNRNLLKLISNLHDIDIEKLRDEANISCG